jgi:hypothetical protein
MFEAMNFLKRKLALFFIEQTHDCAARASAEIKC